MSTIATRTALQLDIRVTDASWAGLFDQLEVWRSRSGSGGPFEEVTGTAWAPASVSILAHPYVVDTKTLSLLVQEQTRVDILFSGSDPLPAATVATQVQAQSNGLLRSYVSGISLIIETAAPGAISILRVLESDASGIFGLEILEPQSVVFGQDARLSLIYGKTAYSFTDPNGSSDYFYRARFRNSGTHEVSEFTEPFQVTALAGLDSSALIVGTIDLVDLTGLAVRNTRVLIYNAFNGSVIQSKVVVGGPLEKLTDETGHAEFTLVRGSTITLSIAGTPLARNVTVPTDPSLTSFNLLDAAYGGPDVFDVQVPNYDYATRRSL